ncbi:MAG: hypothetical protein HYU36_22740 [Planctomycetes bacterium]|nr:hypothetical protein [Planctomycetota bacterium]
MSVLYWLLGLDDTGSIVRSTDWQCSPVSPLPGAILLGLALLALAASALNFLPQSVMPRRTRVFLFLVRLAGFGLLLVMLCRIEARLTLERVARPQVAVLTDVSGSMGLQDAGGRTRLEAARAFQARELASVSDRANLIPYDFHWRMQPENRSARPGGMTRLSEALRSLAAREDDLQAVILLTDGHDTGGDPGKLIAPLFAARKLPIYPVVFGEAGIPRLARVTLRDAAPFVRLGDELPLTATLAATQLGEPIARVRLFEEGRDEPLATRENVRLGQQPTDVRFVVKPERAGERVYRIVMDEIEGSVSQELLVAEHRVAVLDSRIRVLYLDVPRDERKILGHWLARDPVIDLATLTLLPKGGWYGQGALRHANAGEGLPGKEADLYQYDVLIFGDIPRSYFRAGGDLAETKMQWMAEFVGRRGGGLVTLGGRYAYAAGQYQDSALAQLVPFRIEPTREPQMPKPFRLNPTPAGLSHPILQIEADAQASREAWLDLPSIDGCNRAGSVKPGATLLAVRDLEDGPMPVMAIQNVGKGKVLSLAMDTTWRWEMMRPAEGEDYFRRFWGNAVRFLAPDPRIEPNRPQVISYQSSTPVGQTLTLATRLVDGVFQPIRGADVAVEVTRPSGKITRIYPRDGRQAPGLYEYDIDLDEPGDWRVATQFQDKTAEMRFTAGHGAEELDDPRALPEVMRDLAQATGGRAFAWNDASGLAQSLDLSSRRFSQPAAISFWNLPLTMACFIVLVGVDCLIRKRRGMV